MNGEPGDGDEAGADKNELIIESQLALATDSGLSYEDTSPEIVIFRSL